MIPEIRSPQESLAIPGEARLSRYAAYCAKVSRLPREGKPHTIFAPAPIGVLRTAFDTVRVPGTFLMPRCRHVKNHARPSRAALARDLRQRAGLDKCEVEEYSEFLICLKTSDEASRERC
jgi:hypothetical protein